MIGIGEIVLLPLDVLKIKRQTNPEAFRGRGVLKIVADEGFGLYRGWGWTAARNAPGSFAVRIVTYNINWIEELTECSCSVALPSPRSTSSTSRITTRPAGSRTLLLPSLVPLPLSSFPLLSMSSRPVFRTATSRTPRVVSEFCPTWLRTRVLELSSRDLSPRYVYNYKHGHVCDPPTATPT